MSLRPSAHPEVQRELKWFVAHPRFLERVAVHARPFLQHVVAETERRGMPLEIALLPVVESAFNPRATSPHGAAGLWQFIPGTARRYGLRIDHWYDGRRDPVASTSAALDYLQTLHARLGNWDLALAAYNCGELTIERAVAENRNRAGRTDFWSLRLPRETRRFLPRLLAVAAVVRDPSAHGHRFEPLPDTPYFASIPAPHAVDVTHAARATGVDAEEFKALNAAWVRGVTAPQGPATVLVPAAVAPSFATALAALPQAPEPMPGRAYRIRAGDTLGSIANRHGVTVAALQNANHLRGSAIRAGRTLHIPTGPGDPEPPRPTRASTTHQPVVHTVRSGDTLWDIARHYGVSVQRLRHWNALGARDRLDLGTALKIYPAAARGASVEDPAPAATTVEYRVRAGDSLWLIARRHDVGVDDLKRWNGLASDAILQPGQALLIHVPARDPGVQI